MLATKRISGFLVFTLLVVLLSSCGPEFEKRRSYLFKEPLRNQYHFSPVSGWMNDPNGLVFYAGVYHLFYQHYPADKVWGPMHWGHAVSTDLLNWQHKPIALYPDSSGYIFSGSAVADLNNVTGFAASGKVPLVAMFTYHDPKGEQAGKIDFQSQAIAYSLDSGKSWSQYNGNPVIKNPGIRDFRDPKLFRWEKENAWLMALAVKDHVEFFKSENLKNWEKLSEFGKDLGAHGGVWECPDFFTLNDEHGRTKWVLLVSINPGGPQGGSATQYFIGDFDGKQFVAQDTVTRWIDFGADNYAGVTWSGIPEGDGRKLFIGWMSNWQYANAVPEQGWRSSLTLPREIKMVKQAESYNLKFSPAREIEKLLGESSHIQGSFDLSGPGNLIEINGLEGKETKITLSNKKKEQLIIAVGDGKVSIDRKNSGTVGFNDKFPALHSGSLKGMVVKNLKIFLDAASVEVFVNDGDLVMTDVFFPTTPMSSVEIDGATAGATIRSISSVWIK